MTRRNLAPTIERKDGQLETAARHLAKSQTGERELKRQLREARKDNQVLTRVLGEKEQLVATLTGKVDALTSGRDVLRAELEASRGSWWPRIATWWERLCR